MEHDAQSSEARFSEYVDSLSAVLGRDDRAQPLKDYCIGLLMPGERKASILPSLNSDLGALRRFFEKQNAMNIWH